MIGKPSEDLRLINRRVFGIEPEEEIRVVRDYLVVRISLEVIDPSLLMTDDSHPHPDS